MADSDNNGEHATSRGVEWEVVQLTASTYAAAPGPIEGGPADETKETEKATKQEPSGALFMSDHFVFPPSEHENLPIEPEVGEFQGESESLSTDWIDGSTSQNDDNNPYQLELSEERGTIGSMAYTDSKEVQRLNLDEEDRGETRESPGKYAKHGEEKKLDGSDLPCGAWWKRHASSVYRRAKEGNTLWSVVVAATVVGLVILGHRWQREKWQLHQHKWRFSITNESMRRMLS